MSSDRQVLLVGAGGFVGTWIRRALLAAGWHVIGLTRGALPGPGGNAGNFTPVLADATDLGACGLWIDRADAVVFSAAHIPRDHASAAEARACMELNAFTPLEYLRRLAPRPRPFVYISGAQGYRVSGRPAHEGDLLFPAGRATFYLASKLMGDLYTEHGRLVLGLPACVLRAGSIYGPGQARGMVANFVRQALAGQELILQDGGRHTADLTFVGDVAAAAVASLARGARGIFNIGSGRATTAVEAAQHVVAAVGRGPELIRLGQLAGEGPRGFAALDISAAQRELDFIPTAPDDGLRRTVREWTA